MKVLKFGGTSVGTADSLRNVKNIVEGCETPVIVVVSALGGLTDRLIATARMASGGDEKYKSEVDSIRQRHLDIINEVVGPDFREATQKTVSELLDALARIYDGVYLIQDLPSKTLDIIVSYGERMSSVIVTAMISGAERHDSLEFIKTEKWFDRNTADQKLTMQLIQKEFDGFKGIGIVPGFISRDKSTGEITNLGRGGSDFTAALIAAALDAEILEIWTDVDGFMSADPRIIPEAKVLSKMTFTESMELCSFGAKVIYPPTIYPVFHKNIPIKILNTFNPTAPGTIITEKRADSEDSIKGISSINGTTVFNLRCTSDSNIPDFHSRALNALARQGITVFLAENDPSERTLSFAVAENDSAASQSLLTSEFAPELSDSSLEGFNRCNGLATIAVVGDGMKERDRLAQRILNTLSRDGIDVATYSRKPSDTTLSFVIGKDKVKDALRLIHDLVF